MSETVLLYGPCDVDQPHPAHVWGDCGWTFHCPGAPPSPSRVALSPCMQEEK